MKTKELMDYLEKEYPPTAAEEWDNVGLLVGDDSGDTTHVYLALDLTDAALEEAVACGADFILTHHPMIFRGIKKITNRSFTGRRILSLIRHEISYYAMHTNYDIYGMAEMSARVLELSDLQVLSVTQTEEEPQGFGKVGKLQSPQTLGEFTRHVKEGFELEDVRVYGDLNRKVEKIAVCTGSGKSMLQDVFAAGADVYVTGDIDHHTALDAMADGLAIIDAGHYGTEHLFAREMAGKLAQAFPELKLTCAKENKPYTLA